MGFVERLKKLDLTKRDMAELCGVTAQTVSNWGDDPPQYALTILDLYQGDHFEVGIVRKCTK